MDVVPELVRSGVASLKIEGRLKSPEYVANITRIYRKALDETVDGARAGSREVRGTRSAFCSSRPRYEMEMAFSRGLYTGWFRGIDNQALVHAQYGKKRGVYLGEVLRVEREKIVIELQAPVKPGDGVVFDAGKPEEKEEGGRVYQVRAARSGDRHSKPEFQIPNSEVSNPNGGAPNGKPTVLAFGKGDIDFSRVHAGDKVWKTSDPELESRLQESFAGDEPRFQRPIRMEVHGRAGQSLTLVVRDEEGHVARVASAMILSRADKQPLSAERLRRQLGRLGGTGFELSDLSNSLEGAVLLPISELNRLRRLAVNELQTLRSRPKRWKLIPCQRRQGPGVQAPADVPAVGGPATPAREGNLIVLVRDLRQLETAIASGVETVYCEFENPRKYREAVTLFRRSPGGGGRRSVFVAPPRIFKEGEEWTLEQVRSCEADGYLIRNYEHLRFFANQRCVGDFSLNIANHLSADYFKNGFGLERLTASYDLNFTQLEALLRAAPPEWFEVTIHQHMPMFHMEHCVFCAFLSSGSDYTNCGRPCDRHEVKLRDRVGAEHPVKADIGCRNTVFNALAQTGAEYVSRMLALGARHFRIEFLNETPEQVGQTIVRYRQLLRGEIGAPQLWRELKLLNQLGVTRGTLAPPQPGDFAVRP